MQTQKLYQLHEIKKFIHNTQIYDEELKKYCFQKTQPTNDNLITHCNLTILTAINHYKQNYITIGRLEFIINKIGTYKYLNDEKLIPLPKIFQKINTEIWEEELHTHMTHIGIQC